jgi:ferrochelatase
MTVPDKPRIGVLLAQLGTPAAPTPEAVRKYLKEFLSDRRVVEINPVLWFFTLNGIILNTRPQKSAALYQRMFENYGPVLATYTQSLTQKLQAALPQVVMRSGMRYGKPSLREVLRGMVAEAGCGRILLVPLYPQYCASTSGSTYDAVFGELLKMRVVPTLRVMPPYHDTSAYLGSVARLIGEVLERRERPPERLILSYHGIPQRYVAAGDPYAAQCEATTAGLKSCLQFPPEKILHTYQSRFGKEPWLSPYTDETIKSLAATGVKDLLVACPGFTMDCLETIDEIGVENRHVFTGAGGERLQLVSCLNDHPVWVAALTGLIQNELKGWA